MLTLHPSHPGPHRGSSATHPFKVIPILRLLSPFHDFILCPAPTDPLPPTLPLQSHASAGKNNLEKYSHWPTFSPSPQSGCSLVVEPQTPSVHPAHSPRLRRWEVLTNPPATVFVRANSRRPLLHGLDPSERDWQGTAGQRPVCTESTV